MQLHDPELQSQLRAHVVHLAAKIGPRPAGSSAEESAFRYVRDELAAAEVTDRRTLRFPARRSAIEALPLPLLATFFANLPPFPVVRGGVDTISAGLLVRMARAAGAVTVIGAARAIYRSFRAERASGDGARQSSVQLGIVPAVEARRQRLVLVAHLDSPQSFGLLQSARTRPFTRLMGSALVAAPLLNALGQIGAVAFGYRAGRRVRQWTAFGALVAAIMALRESRQPHTPGANANAGGVAALLVLAQHLAANPLPNTEVWFAFTGAGASGGGGLHALLDSYGADLTAARFLVVNRVGSNRLTIAERHAGATHLTGYTPDPYSLSLADDARAAEPVLGVERRTVPGTDETAVLRARGYNAVTLTGYDPMTEYPAAYHSHADTPANLDLDGLERAYHYLHTFARVLDGKLG